MDWPDVERRIAGGENARTEFKRGVGDLGGVGRTLCAFANGDGGLLVIGVDDAGAVVGVGENPETAGAADGFSADWLRQAGERGMRKPFERERRDAWRRGATPRSAPSGGAG